jgi:hypothetical protein
MREPFIIEWHFELEMLISRKWKEKKAAAAANRD